MQSPKYKIDKVCTALRQSLFWPMQLKKNITDTESFLKYKDACQRSESKKVFHSAYQAVDSAGFQYLSVELRLWIPMASGILDSLNGISYSKVQDFRFHKQKISAFRNPDFLARGDLDNSRLLLEAIVFIYRSFLPSFVFKHKYFDPQAGMSVVRNWVKPNKSGFYVSPEWMFYNSIFVLVSCEHLQTKDEKCHWKNIEHIITTFSKLFT